MNQTMHAITLAADDHANAWLSPVISLVVFSLVLAVLAMKVWPKISGSLTERSTKIRDEIESAEMARQQAKDSLAQYQSSLAEARVEAEKMLSDARRQQAALAAELQAKAEAELTAMRDRARRDIEGARRAAVAEIYAEASNLGTRVAANVLKRGVTPADNKQLIADSMSRLATMRS